ncbi:phosphatidylinositol transfer protein domain-containing protein [Phthorimaea operculella]|nr:phosphatidylinositol transfer protein domain-containing protein [Phthorimaea operculella]
MGIRWPDHSSKSPTGYRAQGCIVSSKLVSRLGLNVRPSEDEAVGIGGLNVPDIRGQTNFEFALGSTCTGSAIKSQPWCWMKWLGNSLRKKVLQEAGLVAVDTTGGYVVFGPVWRPQDLPEGDPVLYGSVLSEVLQRFWESEEPPTADRRKPEDDECELFYQYNTARCPSGRFVTRLPFLPNRPALGWIKRFVNNCRKPQAERNFTPVLSPAERNAALCSLVRVVQAEHFEEEVHELEGEKLKMREVINIDIANDIGPSSADYKPETDPTKFKSAKTGRGPLTGPNWRKEVKPVMTCYKLVTAEFKWFGLQSKVENVIHKSEKRLFTIFHRQVFCMMDDWYGMTMADIRAIEERTKEELERLRREGEVRGMRADNDHK